MGTVSAALSFGQWEQVTFRGGPRRVCDKESQNVQQLAGVAVDVWRVSGLSFRTGGWVYDSSGLKTRGGICHSLP